MIVAPIWQSYKLVLKNCVFKPWSTISIVNSWVATIVFTSLNLRKLLFANRWHSVDYQIYRLKVSFSTIVSGLVCCKIECQVRHIFYCSLSLKNNISHCKIQHYQTNRRVILNLQRRRSATVHGLNDETDLNIVCFLTHGNVASFFLKNRKSKLVLSVLKNYHSTIGKTIRVWNGC